MKLVKFDKEVNCVALIIKFSKHHLNTQIHYILCFSIFFLLCEYRYLQFKSLYKEETLRSGSMGINVEDSYRRSCVKGMAIETNTRVKSLDSRHILRNKHRAFPEFTIGKSPSRHVAIFVK